jgi:hypothetical protein
MPASALILLQFEPDDVVKYTQKSAVFLNLAILKSRNYLTTYILSFCCFRCPLGYNPKITG